MPEFWVVNASPVLTLAKSGHLDLLTQLANEQIFFKIKAIYVYGLSDKS